MTFFPDRGGSLDLARELGSGCSVRPDCLTYALEEPVEIERQVAVLDRSELFQKMVSKSIP